MLLGGDLPFDFNSTFTFSIAADATTGFPLSRFSWSAAHPGTPRPRSLDTMTLLLTPLSCGNLQMAEGLIVSVHHLALGVGVFEGLLVELHVFVIEVLAKLLLSQLPDETFERCCMVVLACQRLFDFASLQAFIKLNFEPLEVKARGHDLESVFEDFFYLLFSMAGSYCLDNVIYVVT